MISHVPDPSPRAVVAWQGTGDAARHGLSATLGAIGVALCLLSGVLLSLAAVRLSADRANTYASEIALDAGAIGNDPALGRLESCGQASATTGVPAPQLDRDNRLVCRYRPILRLAQTEGRTTLLASAVEPHFGQDAEVEPLEGDGEVPADCPTTLDDVARERRGLRPRRGLPTCRRRSSNASPSAAPRTRPSTTGPTRRTGRSTASRRSSSTGSSTSTTPGGTRPPSGRRARTIAVTGSSSPSRSTRNDQPVAISYSAHCGGTRRPWARVPVLALAADGRSILVGEDGLSGTHPLVVVAAGSHANYPVVGRREADWTSCALNDDGASLPKQALLQVAKRLTFVGNGLELIPAKGVLQIPDVRLPEQAQRVLQAPWYWGLRETMTLSGIPITDESHGPDSPGLKDDYKRPVDAVHEHHGLGVRREGRLRRHARRGLRPGRQRAAAARAAPKRHAYQPSAIPVADDSASRTSPAAWSGGAAKVATLTTEPPTTSQRGTVPARHSPTDSTRLPRPTTIAPPIGTTSIRAVSSLTWSMSAVAVGTSRVVVSLAKYQTAAQPATPSA